MRILAYQNQFFFTELFFVTTLKKKFQNKVSRKVVGRANKDFEGDVVIIGVLHF